MEVQGFGFANVHKLLCQSMLGTFLTLHNIRWTLNWSRNLSSKLQARPAATLPPESQGHSLSERSTETDYCPGQPSLPCWAPPPSPPPCGARPSPLTPDRAVYHGLNAPSTKRSETTKKGNKDGGCCTRQTEFSYHGHIFV